MIVKTLYTLKEWELGWKMCLNVTECEKDLKIALMFCIKLGVKMKPECWDAAGSRGSVIMWTQEQETGHWMSTSDIPKGTLDAARHRRDEHQRRSSNIQERERNEVGHSRIDTHTCNPSPPSLSLTHTLYITDDWTHTPAPLSSCSSRPFTKKAGNTKQESRKDWDFSTWAQDWEAKLRM